MECPRQLTILIIQKCNKIQIRNHQGHITYASITSSNSMMALLYFYKARVKF